MLYEIKDEEFFERVNIRFKNIQTGFSDFHNGILESKYEDENKLEKFENDIINFLLEVLSLNGSDKSIVDLYVFKLTEEQKIKMMKLLEGEDKAIFLKLLKIKGEGGVYYKLTKDLVPFFVRLSSRGVLFCSFYFLKYECTVWGNYNMKFPIFFNRVESLYKYEEIANRNNLDISCVQINKDC